MRLVVGGFMQIGLKMTVSFSQLEKVPSSLARGFSMTHVYFIEAKLTQKSITHNTHKHTRVSIYAL